MRALADLAEQAPSKSIRLSARVAAPCEPPQSKWIPADRHSAATTAHAPVCWGADFRQQRGADGDLAGAVHAHYRQCDRQQGKRISRDQRLPDEFHGNGRHVAVLARTRTEARSRDGFGLLHPVGVGVDARRLRFG